MSKRKKDARAELDRWPGWHPTIRMTRLHRFWWQGLWKGPLGGAYVHHGFNPRSIERQVHSELARWTRKRRRVRKRVTIVHITK